MNGARHGKWNLMQKCHVFEMGMGTMRPSCTYKLGENIISIAKEEKDLRELIARKTYRYNIW